MTPSPIEPDGSNLRAPEASPDGAGLLGSQILMSTAVSQASKQSPRAPPVPPKRPSRPVSQNHQFPEPPTYDLLRMIDHVKRGSKHPDDYSDYFATDLFEIREIEGKGRGLVATRLIEPGTLLVACKAFAFVAESEEIVVIDRATQRMQRTILPLMLMIERIRSKLETNPEYAEEFFQLWAGEGDQGRTVRPNQSDPVDLDQRISAIIKFNMFTGGDNLLNSTSMDSGVWLRPSYFNHSCSDFNCYNDTIGDFMFVRSIKPIDPGDELLITYLNIARSYESRRRILMENYGFECACRMCRLDQTDDPDQRRRLNEISIVIGEIFGRATRSPYPRQNDVRSIRELIEELLEYRSDSSMNLLLARAYSASAVTLSPVDELASLEANERVFSISKEAGLLFTALRKAKSIASTYSNLGDERSEMEAKKWMQEAEELAKRMYGDERIVELIEE